MSVRTARRTRLFAAASVALAATLSLTACDNGGGTKDAGAAHASSPTTGPESTDDKPSGTAPAPDTQTGTGTGRATSGTPAGTKPRTTPKHADPNAPARRPVCDASRLKVTAQVVSRPLNTMILTATNKGSKLCDLYYAPVVRFEGAQSVPPAMEDTQPQAVVSLQPGESGYAAVKLSSPTGTPDPGHTAKSLSIGFYDKDHRNLDAFAPVRLPAKGVYVDSSIRVSFWQSDLDDVSSL
ncbi:DUF4232 domain-containing protein [Streptomyces sp. NPDC088745]|uniref:DUF4232 domain-containing protein n=1 Tax=Streptomyces sp. NPDC088745 TaxID=3365884 RepID=UPI003822E6DD